MTTFASGSNIVIARLLLDNFSQYAGKDYNPVDSDLQPIREYPKLLLLEKIMNNYRSVLLLIIKGSPF